MSVKPDLKVLPVEWVKRSPLQPRQHFDETQLEELALSIKSSGLIQPLSLIHI